MRAPNLNEVAQAWLLDPRNLFAQHTEQHGVAPAMLRSWVIHGPYHPIWHWWIVSVVHLRPVKGLPEPVKQYPEAEYEFTIVSVAAGPGLSVQTVDIDRIEAGDQDAFPPVLVPPDYTTQLHGLTDSLVEQLADIVAEKIVLGNSPDSDYRSVWDKFIQETCRLMRTSRWN